ncbi:MAG TPA: helix-turn-helix domain-containing protein [Gaiellaceae bacterium]|nr:helix-turn-helix domain-containing protein [Gaiellaceae bacterium]
MSERPGWTFLTSHGSVLLEVAREPDATVREIAERAGLTERQAHRVLADLVASGYLQRQRMGRRNHYRVDEALPMRHPSVADRRVGELLEALGSPTNR